VAPHLFQLLQNYPNPFNPATTIAYEIPAAAPVVVRIFDLHGALISELVNETQPAGRHQTTWNGTDGQGARVASGVYVCAVSCGTMALSQQLLLVK
jgi:flagellar hook assembly protein FlgD